MGVPALPRPVRRLWWHLTLRAQAARRRVARLDWVARHLPWSLWCLLCASDARSVARALGDRSPRPLVFVQVGSNDGVSNDPLHDVVLARQWRGVLVEPVPQLFGELVENYAGRPDLSFENAAVGDGQQKIQPMYVVEPRPGDPDWVNQLASFDVDVVLRHRRDLPGLDDRIHRVDVRTVTLPGLVARHRIDSVDLLHVDTEGFDLEVLRQIDTSAPWAPRFIIFEKKHLQPHDYRSCVGELRRAGYRRVNLWPDELLYRRRPWR